MEEILLLHGAIGSKKQFQELEKSLSSSFLVYRLDFNGHGGSVIPENLFSIKSFAKDVIEFLDANNIKQVSIFGYSMGGYVAMYLAKYYPEKINKIITLATKFFWDQQISAREIKMLDAGKIEEKIPAFATVLKERHQPANWKQVLQKTSDMLAEMGRDNPLKTEDYCTISQPILLMLGDRDKMVTLGETLDVYHNLPNAQLAVIPNTPHPIELVNTARLAFEINSFLLQ